MKCICGFEDWGERKVVKGLTVRECQMCGVLIQESYETIEGAEEYYQKEYINTHTYLEDYWVALKRLSTYKIEAGTKLLDIGSGNGAFVDACISKRIEAEGVDAKAVHPYTYLGMFEKIGFPSDYYDIVTMHDVLEHVVDVRGFLKEVRRVLKENGKLIVDFPLFFSKDGERHWREKQHVWLLSREQVLFLLVDCGFKLERVYEPVPGKVTFWLGNKEKVYDRVVFLPGIGDIYWSLVRFPFIAQERGLSNPVDVSIIQVADEQRDSRSIQYLQKFPFLSTRSVTLIPERKIFEKLYWQDEGVVFQNGLLYIGYNGWLRKGGDLRRKGSVNWYPPFFIPLKVKERAERYREMYGSYVVVYLTDDGMFRDWVRKFTPDQVNQVLNHIRRKHKIVWVGSEWDVDTCFSSYAREDVDCRGKTDFDEVTSLILGSYAVFGYCSGLTFFSVFLKKPTYILWSKYFEDERFFVNSLPEDSLGNWYEYDVVDGLSVSAVIEKWNKLEERFKPATSFEVSVVCVLKSGGDYKAEHVRKLYENVKKYLKIPHEFVCLSDIPFEIEGVKRIPLLHTYSGWWSKVEVFREGIVSTPYILYLDLDTVLVRKVEKLPVSACPLMLRDLGGDGLETGLMYFLAGSLSFIYYEYEPSPERRDAVYVERKLREKGVKYGFLQDVFSGVYSYKYHCKDQVPKDAKIICFHGRPRPWEVKELMVE